jgi:hypothetical protein
MDNTTHLQRMLKTLRIEKGLSKRQFSIGLRLNYFTYCGYENEGKWPPYLFFRALREKYGVDMNCLLFGD